MQYRLVVENSSGRYMCDVEANDIDSIKGEFRKELKRKENLLEQWSKKEGKRSLYVFMPHEFVKVLDLDRGFLYTDHYYVAPYNPNSGGTAFVRVLVGEDSERHQAEFSVRDLFHLQRQLISACRYDGVFSRKWNDDAPREVRVSTGGDYRLIANLSNDYGLETDLSDVVIEEGGDNV